MSKKKNTRKDQAPRKRRITPRQLMSAWIVVAIAGTGAWYALAALPDGNNIQQLQNDLRRTESRLTENRERVTELEAEIRELEESADQLDAEYGAYAGFVGELEATADYGEALTTVLAEAGLEVTQAEAPKTWEAIVGPYRKATFTLDATGTYSAAMTALNALEARAGVSLRELQIAKSGGDPDDPLLITRFTLTAHVKAN